MQIDSNTLKTHLVQAASGSLATRITAMALMILTSIVLARFLGPSQLGAYSLALSIAQILLIPAVCGLNIVSTKETAALVEKREWSLFSGLKRFCVKASFSISCLIAIGSALIIVFLKKSSPPSSISVLLALLALPIFAQIQIRASILRGLNYIIISQIADILRPIVFISLLASAYFVLKGNVQAPTAMVCYIISAFVVMLLLAFLLKSKIPGEVFGIVPSYNLRIWIKAWLTLMLASGVQIINEQTPILMLGSLASAEDVGLYRVAISASRPVGIALLSVNIAIGPTIARMYAAGEFDKMQKIVTKSTQAMFFFAFPLALLLVLCGSWLVPFIFGRNFELSVLPLSILCVGLLINTAMGSVGLLLNMTGLEKFTVIGNFCSLCLNMGSGFILIPLLGASGAAIASSIGLIAWNIVLSVSVYKHLHIVTPSFLSDAYLRKISTSNEKTYNDE